jgi:hypothetical protein
MIMIEYRVVRQGITNPVWAVQSKELYDCDWEFVWNMKVKTNPFWYSDNRCNFSEHPPLYFNSKEDAFDKLSQLQKRDRDYDTKLREIREEREWVVET